MTTTRRLRTVGAGLAASAMLWAAPGLPVPAATAATKPTGRSGMAMTYDGGSKTVLVFGGHEEFSGRTGKLNDTWTWNGTAWKRREPATKPPAREHASMAYDGARNKVVLFGGTSNTCGTFVDDSCARLNDTWIWDGVAKTWTQMVLPVSPSPRSGAAMAYDKASRKIVLFGGDSHTAFLNDTWTWDGDDWTRESPSQSPPPRRYSSLAGDGGRVVLFSGDILDPPDFAQPADTWTWSGTNSTWTKESPASAPARRAAAAMAYDAARKRTVLFGGDGACCAHLTDTWTWDGTTKSWAPVSNTGPSARFFHGMAYDPVRQRVVVFGGSTKVGVEENDVWEWNGTAWKKKL